MRYAQFPSLPSKEHSLTVRLVRTYEGGPFPELWDLSSGSGYRMTGFERPSIVGLCGVAL
jgi:hypothetical protein